MGRGAEGGIGGRASTGIPTPAEGSSGVRLEQGRAGRGVPAASWGRKLPALPVRRGRRRCSGGREARPTCAAGAGGRGWTAEAERAGAATWQ